MDDYYQKLNHLHQLNHWFFVKNMLSNVKNSNTIQK
jgi:hypothetical protein